MTALDDAIAKAECSLYDKDRADLIETTNGHRPHEREVALARALKAVAEVLDDATDVWSDDDDAVLAIKWIRAAIERRLTEGK